MTTVHTGNRRKAKRERNTYLRAHGMERVLIKMSPTTRGLAESLMQYQWVAHASILGDGVALNSAEHPDGQ